MRAIVRCANWDFGRGNKGTLTRGLKVYRKEKAFFTELCKAKCKKYDDCEIREQAELKAMGIN